MVSFERPKTEPHHRNVNLKFWPRSKTLRDPTWSWCLTVVAVIGPYTISKSQGPLFIWTASDGVSEFLYGLVSSEDESSLLRDTGVPQVQTRSWTNHTGRSILTKNDKILLTFLQFPSYYKVLCPLDML